MIKLGLRNRHHTQAGLSKEGDIRKCRLGFDFLKCDWADQGAHRLQIHARPIALAGSGVRVGLTAHLGDANDGLPRDAVVIQRPITECHVTKIVAGLKVPHPSPCSHPIADKLIPRVGGGFLFNEPIFHSCFAKWKNAEYQRALLKMSKKGIFITFEGSEGCGKSTQIGLLAAHLRDAGHDPLLLREPGGTPAGESIRHLLQHAPEGENLTPEAELLLFAASRAQLVREVIVPALTAGRIVICDRFLDSTTVYQGVGRKIPPQQTEMINAFAVDACLPDVTFLLDLDRPTSLERMKSGQRTLDRIERESEEFFEAVRNGYLELAALNPNRILLLDASKSKETTLEEIKNAIASLLSK